MSDPSPTPTTQLSPLGQAAQQDGIVMTQMLIVADVERSVSFYRDVLGATVLREHSPPCFASTTAGSSSTAAEDRRQTSLR